MALVDRIGSITHVYVRTLLKLCGVDRIRVYAQDFHVFALGAINLIKVQIGTVHKPDEFRPWLPDLEVLTLNITRGSAEVPVPVTRLSS
jgi:hypothetical protein